MSPYAVLNFNGFRGGYQSLLHNGAADSRPYFSGGHLWTYPR